MGRALLILERLSPRCLFLCFNNFSLLMEFVFLFCGIYFFMIWLISFFFMRDFIIIFWESLLSLVEKFYFFFVRKNFLSAWIVEYRLFIFGCDVIMMTDSSYTRIEKLLRSAYFVITFRSILLFFRSIFSVY